MTCPYCWLQVALDLLVLAAQCKQPIDVMALIRRMRGCRNFMVQSVQQFVFVHRLACGNFDIGFGFGP